MPVEFESYDPAQGRNDPAQGRNDPAQGRNDLTEGTNAKAIHPALVEHPDPGFTPRGVHEASGSHAGAEDRR